ncbi:MAG: hypothetical protein WDZ76_01310 [Pseudohongiellaceae bacterium]
MKTRGFGAYARRALPYLLIIVVTLVLLDLVLIASGLYPPTYSYGHPDLGWVSARSASRMASYQCMEKSLQQSHTVQLNEDGHRSSRSIIGLRGPGKVFEIAVSGDSHTDLCADNSETHFGFMESELNERGVSAVTFAYGAGRYSPLQAYLAIEEGIRANQADAFVLNLYVGNDFFDMMRVDDRPYLTPGEDGYKITEPVWYSYDSPDSVKHSRVLYVLNQAAKGVGIKSLTVRLRFLYDTAREQGMGVGAVAGYMNAIRRSMSSDLGYPAAFSAQILNQQLFFEYFPGSRDESLRRVAALMSAIRERHPDLMLIMSPIPSYQAAYTQPVDPAFLSVLDQLSLNHEEGMRKEEVLHERLRAEARGAGWLFVDNMAALQAYDGHARLYNDFDYHITPAAGEVIGRGQAAVIAAAIRRARDSATDTTVSTTDVAADW